MTTTTPPILNVEDYLQPIRDDAPSGESLRWEREYEQLEEARRADDGSDNEGAWVKRNRKLSDWKSVTRLGLEILDSKSKDLQVAVWVTEALAEQHGLAGLRDGLKLLTAIQETFWTTAHPGAEDGRVDTELREGLYEFLDNDRRLPLIVRNAPVTQVSGLPSLLVPEVRGVSGRRE